jgi:cell division protein FtsQ
LKANKKVRKNSLRPIDGDVSALGIDFMGSLDLVLKFILVVLVLALSSLGLIFVHDFITQSPYFGIKTIHISGATSLSDSALLSQAGIKMGDNLMAVNLKTVRARLVAHPWVRDAAIQRQVPSTLAITVSEQTAVARAVMADASQVLVDVQGQPFKPYEPEIEPQTACLPEIKGLRLEPLDPWSMAPQYGFKGELHQGVMELLALDTQFPAREITAYKDLGIDFTTDFFMTHKAVGEASVIVKLGFDGFRDKLAGTGKILDYMDGFAVEKRVRLIDFFNIRSVTITLEDKDILPGTT